MRQCTLIGRRRWMIAFDHFRPFAALLLELERRLEEVDVEPCRRIETTHHTRRFEAVEAAVAHQAAHDGITSFLTRQWTRFMRLALMKAMPVTRLRPQSLD